MAWGQRGGVAAREGSYGDTRDEDRAAAYADIDVGMGGGGFTPVGDPRDFRAGPDNPDMPSPDVIAAIADQLDAASNAPSAVAVNQQGDRLSNAQVQALINLQDQYQTQDPLGNTTSVLDTWSNPYVSQNYSDYAQGGQNIVGQGNVSRGLNYANAMEIDARRQELSAELDRLNTLSVQASDATQPYPSSWSDPDEWGMSDTRLDQRMRGPGNVSDMDMLAQQGMPDSNARRSWEIQNPSPLASSSPGPIASHFPSPLTSVADYPADMEGMPNVGLPQASIAEGVMGAPGTYSGTVNAYDTARDASLAFDEYEMPSRQQQRRAPSIAASPFDAGVMPSGGRYERSVFDDYQPQEWGGPDTAGAGLPDSDIEVSVADAVFDLNQMGANITSQDFWVVSQQLDLNKDVETAVDNSVTTEPVKDAVKQGKKLTAQDKKNNIDKRRAAEKGWLDHADKLKDEMDAAIQEHGIISKEAGKASKAYRNWVDTDFYTSAYGSINRPGTGQNIPGVGWVVKGLTGIQEYFHSLGKTERRTADEIIQDMKDNPEKYEDRPEISAAQLVRNMYSFLRKAPMDVAAAAAKEPAYLRYLINLNVNKQPIPTSYSSNWKNDISDAWIYG